MNTHGQWFPSLPNFWITNEIPPISVSLWFWFGLISDSVQKSSGPLQVDIARSAGSVLGLSLTTSLYRNKQVITIQKIKPASVADRWAHTNADKTIHEKNHIHKYITTNVQKHGPPLQARFRHWIKKDNCDFFSLLTSSLRIASRNSDLFFFKIIQNII